VQAQLDAARAELAELSEQNKGLEDSHLANANDVQAQLDAARAELAELSEQNKGLEDSHLANANAVQAQLDAARAELVELSEQNEGLEDSHLENLESINTLENDLANAKANAAGFKAQLDSAVEVLQSTQSELTAEIVRKEELEGELAAISDSLADAKVAIEIITSERDEIQEKFAGVAEVLEVERQSNAAESGEVAEALTAKLVELEAALAATNATLAEKESDLAQKVQLLDETIQNAETDIENFAATQDKLAASQNEVISTQKLLAETTERVQEVGNACAEMERQRKVAAEELADAQNEIGNLNVQIAGMSEELEHERVAAQKATAAAMSTAQGLQDAQFDAMIEVEGKHEEVVSTLTAEKDTLAKNNDSLEKNCSELREEIDELQQRLTALQSDARTSETTAADMATIQAELAQVKHDA